MPRLDDQTRADIQAMILDVEQLDPALVDGSYDVAAPDPTQEPTQDHVDDASATVISIENKQNEMRAALSALNERFNLMTYFVGKYSDVVSASSAADDAGRADVALYESFDEARYALRDYIDELIAAEQLTTQMLDHWRSALAVIEHDLKWQAYVAEAFGATENPRHGAAAPQSRRDLDASLRAAGSAERTRSQPTGAPS